MGEGSPALSKIQETLFPHWLDIYRLDRGRVGDRPTTVSALLRLQSLAANQYVTPFNQLIRSLSIGSP